MGNKRNARVEKSPIKLRRKLLADGRESLYLDQYVGGRHQYEFLKLYLVPEENAKAARENRRALRQAERILKERVESFYNNKVNLSSQDGPGAIKLSDWVATCHERRLARGESGANMMCAGRALACFNPDVTLGQIDKEFCLGFIDWLRNSYKTRRGVPVAQKTAYTYSAILRTVLNDAVQEGLIEKNPWKQLAPIDKIKDPPSRRAYLTIDEVKSLIATECESEVVKRAFLFACFSGLRISDVRRLVWKDVTTAGENWSVSVVMVKTREPVVVPISHQARKWMGAPTESDSCVFAGLPKDEKVNAIIKEWVADAGITKRVTFHVARHTCATMLLTLGADIYTVSKILGHTSLRYTQIYAKIVDSKKDNAVNLVNSVF